MISQFMKVPNRKTGSSRYEKNDKGFIIHAVIQKFLDIEYYSFIIINNKNNLRT